MRILFVAQKYDYGRPERGYGFEYYNFFESLVQMGHEVTYFDINAAPPGEQLSDRLLSQVKAVQPTLMFTCLFENELERSVIRQITDAGDTVTFNWFCDDDWRFDNYSQLWAPAFRFVSTTTASALPKYRAAGIDGVLKTQWGAATHRYRPEGRPLRYDTTFVGQNYGSRADVVAELRQAGVSVQTWGTGWAVPKWQRRILEKRGIRHLGGGAVLRRRDARTRCTQDEMIAIFEQSRVSLNLSAASQGSGRQIKGRTFEIPACRGVLVTGAADGLEGYYEPGREIIVYESEAELPELIRSLSSDQPRRDRIAEAGYRRTVAEHSYQRRFTDLFAQMGITDG
jgi:spore maturation protein CgeB